MKISQFLDTIVSGLRRNRDWDEVEFREWLERTTTQERIEDDPDDLGDSMQLLPDYYAYAKSLVGLKEVPGPASNPKILAMIRQWLPSADDDSTTAWCGALVAHVMAEFGYPIAEHPLLARSWMHVYREVPYDQAREGDLAVLWRGAPSDWRGHVAFVDGADKDQISLLGGNQSNAVTIEQYGANRVLGVYRP